jgi:hypothetical protein
MDVDPDDGTIHVAFYDTRDSANRVQTHLYYIASKDGGNNWINETRVTTAPTDETAAGADSGNQYGDYNGLVAYRNAVHPSWTDRRAGVPGGREQIFTARLRESPLVVFDICERAPLLCVEPIELGPELLTIECRIRPCVVVDFLPKNCLVKFECPGCPPGGLCPPFYHLFLDGMDGAWELSLISPKGSPAPVYRTIRRPPTGLVVSFRPSSEGFEEGKIGSYALAFRLKPEGRTGHRYRVKASLRTGDRHYRP